MSQPPLHRHLSTIGIGPVFICPPPHHLFQQTVDEDPSVRSDHNVRSDAPNSLSGQRRRDIITWEIVGDIKTIPEDFIVREIGWAPAPIAPPIERGDDENGDEEATSTAKHNTDKNGRSPPVWCRRIAGLECKSQSETRLDGVDVEKECISEVLSKGTENEKVADQIIPTSTVIKTIAEEITKSDPSAMNIFSSSMKPYLSVSPTMAQNDTVMDGSVDPNPTHQELRRILINCLRNIDMISDEMGESQPSHDDGEAASNTILQQLADLQNHALEEIDSASHAVLGGPSCDMIDRDLAYDKNAVWIPTFQLFQSSLAPFNTSSEDWTLLHRYIRQIFPLLRTESSSVGPSGVENEDDGSDSKFKDKDFGIKHESDFINKSWVCALVDYTFFSIAPCLANPRQALLQLYQFRNHGPSRVLSEDGNVNRTRARQQRRGGRYNRKSCDSREVLEDNQDNMLNDSSNSKQGTVLLLLRPDLPRSERRVIHQTLASSRRREFETSTTNYGQSDHADNDTSTAAIVVKWSRKSVSQKKRKRTSNVSSSQSEQRPAITAVFCVLRKYQCEHQVAITSVARALRCRAGDIGLAGIKDMQAITYQFCTIRNVDTKKAQLANNSLGKRVHLSNFIEITGSDVLLDRGKLIGSECDPSYMYILCESAESKQPFALTEIDQFEIVIRHLKRVQLFQSEGDKSWTERTIPVHSSHLDAMVKRINDFGFINFYGEQRVGDAGVRSYVGVRSFDVGRAMLQRDFSKAVDLIMTGRTSQVYNPGAEEINAREVWKSGGNARETLKAFPKNSSAMLRERDLMKGMLRYNDPLEAIRCIPHNIRMFWIHGYQSYVWNRIATERIKRWGLCPVVGDLYLEKATRSDDEGYVAEDLHVKVVQNPTSIHISQIVLPLPGYNIQYPQNEIGELIEEILHGDGVDFSRGNIPEATAKGSYRKLVQRANKLMWSAVSEQGKGEPDVSDDPMVASARFTFELESGCYATMMLRELMVTTMARDTCKME